jgi:hypothetical protein
VVERVAKVEMNLLLQWRVGVEWSEEIVPRRWCRFNTSVLAQEGRHGMKRYLKMKWRQ